VATRSDSGGRRPGGGLPRGRTTLIAGAAGAGKTLFGLEFLVRGACDYDEPGVLLSFEESAAELAENATSLGLDLAELEADGRLVVDAIRIDPSEIVTNGEFDLDGLFIRLDAAVRAVGAKRVVLDTMEVLFGALGDDAVVRGELGRLLRWLKDRGLTTVITGERGREGQLTRLGIEDYVSDCVIVLDHRMRQDVATRRLRVVKYRGSSHGTNEYPFLITDRGLTVYPITSTQMNYTVSSERVSLGVPQLDQMLGGGVYRGSTVLLTGTPGTGKTTLGAHAVDAACARGERALFVSFEESPAQLIRNLRSVGMDLGRWVDKGLLRLWGERSSSLGLEAHVARIERLLDETDPTVVVLDSVGSLTNVGPVNEVNSALARELDMMKGRGVTGMITSLTHDGVSESSSLAISSLIDTWLVLRNVESDAERNRLLSVFKSRGTAHSNQVREFLLTDHGAELQEVVIGPRGVLTGSARALHAAQDRAERADRAAEFARRRLALDRRSIEVGAQIAALRDQLATETAELDRLESDESRSEDADAAARASASRRRESGRQGSVPAGRVG
jgi:circadian clock protein KaiC